MIVGGDGSNRTENIDFAEIEGVEFDLSGRYESLGWAANFGYSETRNAATDVFLDDRPVVTYNFSVDQQIGSFSYVATVRGEKGRHDSEFDLQTFTNVSRELESYAVIDLSAVYNVSEQLSVNAAIFNLFDEDYSINLAGNGAEFETLERSFKLGVKYQF